MRRVRVAPDDLRETMIPASPNFISTGASLAAARAARIAREGVTRAPRWRWEGGGGKEKKMIITMTHNSRRLLDGRARCTTGRNRRRVAASCFRIRGHSASLFSVSLSRMSPLFVFAFLIVSASAMESSVRRKPRKSRSLAQNVSRET